MVKVLARTSNGGEKWIRDLRNNNAVRQFSDLATALAWCKHNQVKVVSVAEILTTEEAV